ncbi:uncharacterized protein DNG_00957 [Cephalotrichum gorgonifer]|uniref:Uncharacterized protein n=1 Tax=Cephalotrichum gorgonifer TaxID=2041049 RepID=A0AAE8MQ06_9PEZI|nr:uncharacterized protein DNG_00957 [Cephalotrichum gorgonifer]
MLACRRSSRLCLPWQARPSSRAGFSTSGAAPAAKKTAPRPSKPKPKSKPPPLPYQAKPNPNPQPTGPPPPQNGKKLITAPLAGALALAVVFGYFAAVSVVPSSSSADPSRPTPTDPLYARGAAAAAATEPTGRPTSLSGISAAEFDKELDYEESRTGVTKLREKLAGRARGHVLEIAVGTGRNFARYDWDALVPGAGEGEGRAEEGSSSGKGGRGAGEAAKGKAEQPKADDEQERGEMLSFTGVDIASDMLDVAASKLKKSVPALKTAEPTVTVLRNDDGEVAAGAVSFLSDAIRLVKSDALSYLPPPSSSRDPSPSPSGGGAPGHARHYDTIIQTFGLCSVSNPKAVLSSLAPLLRPDSGRIYLLEHGRGTWSLMNWWLDRHAPAHFTKYGCWWNRDLEAVVRDACRDRIGGRRVEVVKVERPGWQGGTVLWIELKVVEEA